MAIFTRLCIQLKLCSCGRRGELMERQVPGWCFPKEMKKVSVFRVIDTFWLSLGCVETWANVFCGNSMQFD